MQKDDPNRPVEKIVSDRTQVNLPRSARSDLIQLKEDLGHPPGRLWTTVANVGSAFAGLYAIQNVALGVYGIATGKSNSSAILKTSEKMIVNGLDKTAGRKVGLGNLAIGLGLGAFSFATYAESQTAVRARNLLRLYNELSAKENQPSNSR